MSLVVMKFGGSSVADADSVKRVARRCIDAKKRGNDVVVIVSAMGDTTDDLLDLADQVTPLPPPRELDMLLSSGERISVAVLAMAIANLGYEARSFTGRQAGITTDDTFGNARILDVQPARIMEALADGNIVIVAGFQGRGQHTGAVTTMGRGGSDTTAVALAAALDADVCEIYTDVDGVFTADPRVVPAARKIPRVTPEEMLEMSSSGAKVLMLRCVEYARRYRIPIHVRSSFSQKEGTLVIDHEEGEDVEAPMISGVTYDRSQAKITIVGVPDSPGMAAKIFEAIGQAGINVDMIVQNVSAAETNTTDITFTLPMAEGPKAAQFLKRAQDQVGFASLRYDDQIGKLSLIGAGMKSHPGVSANFFRALASVDVNVEMIATSEIRISIITRDDQLDEAVRAVHTAFGLDSATGEAVVYGGTGR